MAWRRAAALLAALAFVSGSAVGGQPEEAGRQSPTVVVAEYEGIIHPIADEFVGDLLARARAADAKLAVLVLRTPGGLVESTRSIVQRMIDSPVPVAVFVGPAGARAASAGFIITIAADLAAMAPGTHIGAAHPVASGGGDSQGSETMSEKAASDLAAYARTLAEARGRNVELAAAAVLESRAFTEHEALSATPPLIDLVASDVDELLRSADGRRIRRFNGTEQTLQTSNPVIERVEMTRRQRLLAAIAHPQIAYLLMTLGMLGLVVEMWNPGAIVPGVVGGICLLLAFFAFQVLPVDITGIALIVLGMVLITIEVFVPSFGILGIGGIVALVAGAVMLTPEIPGVTVNYQFIVPVAIAAAALVFFLGRLGLKAQRARPVTGAEGLVGARARALTDIAPGRPGQVHVHGEIWSAASEKPIAAGAEVRVRAIEGLRLEVEPGDSPFSRGDTT